METLLSLLKSFFLETVKQQRQSIEPISSSSQPPVTATSADHRTIAILGQKDCVLRSVEYPLTPLQRAMLSDLLIQRPDGTYVQQLSCYFSAGLDIPRLVSIWQTMIHHIEVLRLKILGPRSAPTATIETGHVQLPYEEQDWSSLDETGQEELWARLLRDDRAKGFLLSDAPLMRLHFVKTGPQAYRMLWTFHHLILDGWSVGLLLDRVSQIYAQKVEAESTQASSPSQREFAAWLNEKSSSTSQNFWRTYFNGYRWPSSFLPSTPNGIIPPKTRRMDEYQVCLVNPLCKGLIELSRKANVTLYTLLQGAWALTLGALSREDDLVFGAVVSGRSCDYPGIQELIGMCANTMMVRIMLRDQNLKEWLADLQMMNLTMRMYEQTPLSKVRMWSGVPARKQLFDSVFVFENYPVNRCLESLKPIGVTYVKTEEQTNLPFSVVVEPGNPFLIRFVYDSHLWSRPDAVVVATVMQSILEQIVANPTSSARNYARAAERMSQEALAQGH